MLYTAREPELVTVRETSADVPDSSTVCVLPSVPIQEREVRVTPSLAVTLTFMVKDSPSNRRVVPFSTEEPLMDTAARASLKDTVTRRLDIFSMSDSVMPK